MLRFLVAVFAVALTLFSSVNAQTLNTPNVVVFCQPLQLTWTGGTGPFIINVLPGATGSPIHSFTNLNGNSYTYLVDIPAGTTISFYLTDSTGSHSQTSLLTVSSNGSSDTTCPAASSLSSTGTVSSGSSKTGTTSSPTGTTTNSTPTTPAVVATSKPTVLPNSSTPGSGSSVSSSSKPSTSTTSTSAAYKVVGNPAIVGVLGTVALALLV